MKTLPKVLIIEDDLDIRETLKMILESEGYHVGTAPNGKLGLELLTHPPHPPDLILLDLMMPVMNGYEFLEKKNELPQELKAIPVVVLSALQPTTPSLLGVQETLGKPVEIKVLLDSVKKYAFYRG